MLTLIEGVFMTIKLKSRDIKIVTAAIQVITNYSKHLLPTTESGLAIKDTYLNTTGKKRNSRRKEIKTI
jgi:hypothetical protein